MPKMMDIPGGSFVMGDANGSREMGDTEELDSVRVDPNEKPLRVVEIAPFAIGKYEVTFDEYDRFAEATGRDCIA